MQIVILLAAMVAVGLVVGWLAGLIWPQERPVGIMGDYLVSVGTAIVVGLLDWFVIPAMGFSPAVTYVGVVIEPPLAALFVLWLIKRAKE